MNQAASKREALQSSNASDIRFELHPRYPNTSLCLSLTPPLNRYPLRMLFAFSEYLLNAHAKEQENIVVYLPMHGLLPPS
jgi:hypothetical protein